MAQRRRPPDTPPKRKRPPDNPERLYDEPHGADTPYLIDDNLPSDRKERLRGRLTGDSSAPKEEDMEQLFDIPERFTIPDTSGEVDPHGRVDETDISSKSIYLLGTLLVEYYWNTYPTMEYGTLVIAYSIMNGRFDLLDF